MEAAQKVEAGCLAGAVRTDQPDDLARLDGEIEATDRRQSAEALREVARLEQRHVSGDRAGCGGRCRPPPPQSAELRRQRDQAPGQEQNRRQHGDREEYRLVRTAAERLGQQGQEDRADDRSAASSRITSTKATATIAKYTPRSLSAG